MAGAKKQMDISIFGIGYVGAVSAGCLSADGHRVTAVDTSQFKVDAINARSRAAVAKLGARLDGIIRNDRIVWTGRQRDTCVFSILAGEWPMVRDKLEARLMAVMSARV